MSDREARESPEWKEHWKPSLEAEVNALWGLNTFEAVRREVMEKSGKKPKKIKSVRKIKQKRDGTIEKYKTRLVVQGFSLIPNDEFFDSYSSVIAAGNTRMLMYLAAQTGEELSSADIGNAYLEAELPEDEVIYVEQHDDAQLPGKPKKDLSLIHI